MTRYEMAEIIYNALSKGAKAEKKLVEEFKPELQPWPHRKKHRLKKRACRTATSPFYAVGVARGRPVRSVDDFLSKTIGESYSS